METVSDSISLQSEEDNLKFGRERLTSGSHQSGNTPYAGLKVGDHLRVKLFNTDVQRGFIDFARA